MGYLRRLFGLKERKPSPHDIYRGLEQLRKVVSKFERATTRFLVGAIQSYYALPDGKEKKALREEIKKYREFRGEILEELGRKLEGFKSEYYAKALGYDTPRTIEDTLRSMEELRRRIRSRYLK